MNETIVKEAGVKKLTSGLYQHLNEEIGIRKLIEQRQKFLDWYEYTYPAHTGKIVMRREILFFMKTQLDPYSIFKRDDMIEVLYLMENLDISAWTKKAQIDALVTILEDWLDIKLHNPLLLKNDLLKCSTLLDNLDMTLKEYITDIIKDEETQFLKVDERPIVNPFLKNMNVALKESRRLMKTKIKGC